VGAESTYAAFISYSSRDAAFARRLHRALESYRIPKALGPVRLSASDRSVNRAYPCFRDREELSSGHLGQAIERALDASAALIVVCSPDSARSEWVEKEIRYFEALGRGDRIFAIIADGEPGASERGDMAAECFPLALRPDARRAAGEQPPPEIVAGDARADKDGFRPAWLKVLAGMAGLGLGQLMDRDAARRRADLVRSSLLVGAVATVTGILSTAWIFAQARAEDETRARLAGEMRSAFELGDDRRAVAVLAYLHEHVDARERVKLGRVLAAWLPRWPSKLGTLEALPATSVFQSGGRLYLKYAGKVTYVGSDVEATTAPDHAGGVFVIDRQAQLWRAGPGGAARRVDLKAPLSRDVSWRTAAFVDGRLLVLGEDKIMVDEDGGVLHCASVEPSSGSVSVDELYGDLEDGAAQDSRCEALVDPFVKGGAHPDLDGADPAHSGAASWNWRAGARTPSEGGLADFGILCAAEEANLCGWGARHDLAAAGPSAPPVLIRQSDPGDAGLLAVEICTIAPRSREPNCASTSTRGAGVRVFDTHVYLQDHAFESTQPMFRLLDRRTGAIRDFNAREVRGLSGAVGGLVALSPTQRRIAMGVAGEVLVFAVADGSLSAAPSHRFSAPVLAGRDAGGVLAFAGEDRVVVVRNSGLAAAYDVTSGAELWRTRMLSSRVDMWPNAQGDLHAAGSVDGRRLAISGDTYLVVLDSETGLQLLPAVSVDPPRDRKSDRIDHVYGTYESRLGEAGLDIAQLRTDWARAHLLAELPALSAAADGGFRFEQRDRLYTISALAGGEANHRDLSRLRCVTGWEVRGGRVSSFDFLQSVRPNGEAVAISALARACEGAG
jgi:hypothetical protein